MDDRLTDAGAAAARAPAAASRREMIAVAAYYRAEHRGFAAGDPAADWLEAEAEIDRLFETDVGDAATRQSFQRALAEQLKDWDAMLAEWRQRAAESKGKARSEVQKQLDAFAQQRELAEQKLFELRAHSGEAWQNLKEGVDRAWQEMRSTMDRIAARFK